MQNPLNQPVFTNKRKQTLCFIVPELFSLSRHMYGIARKQFGHTFKLKNFLLMLLAFCRR